MGTAMDLSDPERHVLRLALRLELEFDPQLVVG